MLLSHGEHRQSFKQKKDDEAKKQRRRSSGQPQAKQSLAVLAQLMLPALIEENAAQVSREKCSQFIIIFIQDDVLINFKPDGAAQNRRHVNGLLQRANGQMRKGAAGVWDVR